jgi:hypothetical protein
LIPGAPLVLVVSITTPIGANRLSDGFRFVASETNLGLPSALPSMRQHGASIETAS